MKHYLFDTNILRAYLRGRSGVVNIVQTWIHNDEAATSIVVYGEIIEYFKSFSQYPRYQAARRVRLRKVHPYSLTYTTLEQYADVRRTMRPPYGAGLIGDIDTLIAATALSYKLTVVTTDSDFARVPELSVMLLPSHILKG